MNDNRKQLVQHIVDIYTNKYTAAMFCDRSDDVERYTRQANDWFVEQRAANNITSDEIAIALKAVTEIAEQNHQPLGYDDELLKNKGEQMPTITTLIINEMKSVLGHEPTKPEMDSLSAFIAGRKLTYLAELELAIADWKNACTRECAWCGDRFLESEMIHTAGSEWFCNDQCKKDYKENHPVAEETED